MGIGELYKRVNEELGHTVITVDADPNKNADFISVEAALKVNKSFDTAHVCTPNYTHYDIAKELYYRTNILFVEKPGFKNLYQYCQINSGTETRVMMVKNNQYRNNITEMCDAYETSNFIKLNWINADRIPHPGSWFTNKKLAFGGVSRDLFPHMLSFLPVFDRRIYQHDIQFSNMRRVYQNWDLNTIKSTAYGTVKTNGVYDVDDYNFVEIEWNNKIIQITCDWKSRIGVDDQSITFTDFSRKYSSEPIERKFQLGLCPEYAYKNMIVNAIKCLDDDQFWEYQKLQDLWIAQKVIDLCA